ncbi:hypothetical protein EYF80_040064 [Liparis tanakae]|uniref:Uncharacterized protein n=1 Tax=Liparis tanakae TaxID=230148 RepID=A0A4Z2G9J3_9TELE|nr:hypothetical protein EYF80_040064 [Liparis tanakae]
MPRLNGSLRLPRRAAGSAHRSAVTEAAVRSRRTEEEHGPPVLDLVSIPMALPAFLCFLPQRLGLIGPVLRQASRSSARRLARRRALLACAHRDGAKKK